jgi:hypothetical protein
MFRHRQIGGSGHSCLQGVEIGKRLRMDFAFAPPLPGRQQEILS